MDLTCFFPPAATANYSSYEQFITLERGGIVTSLGQVVGTFDPDVSVIIALSGFDNLIDGSTGISGVTSLPGLTILMLRTR